MQHLFCSTREGPLIILPYSVIIRFVKYFSMSFRVIDVKKIRYLVPSYFVFRDDFLKRNIFSVTLIKNKQVNHAFNTLQ